MQPDYSSQLARIANALDRTQTPQWVYILLGSLLTVLTQILIRYIEHLRKLYKMRKVAYSDLLVMYEVADQLLLDLPNNETPAMMKARHKVTLNDMFKFHAEEYCNKDYDTFVSLGDKPYIETLFRKYRAGIQDDQNQNMMLLDAAHMTAQFFVTGNLSRRFAKRCGIGTVDEILKSMRNRYDDARACRVGGNS